MAKEERWQIASDAELVKRGRILTVLGVIILCLGSLVTVALMSVTGSSGPQRTSGGPIHISAPQVADNSTGGGSGSGGATTGGGQGSGAGTTTGGGAETPETRLNPDGTPANPQVGNSNVDPNAKPAPGTNVLGLPVLGAAPATPTPPPVNTGETIEF